MTAQSFADALNRDVQPQLASPATVYLRDIVGAARVLDGTAQSISGIQALGPYRLRIRLTKPAGDLTARLTIRSSARSSRERRPWAPYVHLPRHVFVSGSTGCVIVHPVYGFDIAAACKK